MTHPIHTHPEFYVCDYANAEPAFGSTHAFDRKMNDLIVREGGETRVYINGWDENKQQANIKNRAPNAVYKDGDFAGQHALLNSSLDITGDRTADPVKFIKGGFGHGDAMVLALTETQYEDLKSKANRIPVEGGEAAYDFNRDGAADTARKATVDSQTWVYVSLQHLDID